MYRLKWKSEKMALLISVVMATTLSVVMAINFDTLISYHLLINNWFMLSELWMHTESLVSMREA